MGSSLLGVMTTKETSYGIDPHHHRSGVVVWRRRLLGASARSLVGGGAHRARMSDFSQILPRATRACLRALHADLGHPRFRDRARALHSSTIILRARVPKLLAGAPDR